MKRRGVITLLRSSSLVIGRRWVASGWRRSRRLHPTSPEPLRSCTLKLSRIRAPSGLGLPSPKARDAGGGTEARAAPTRRAREQRAGFHDDFGHLYASARAHGRAGSTSAG